MLDTGSQNVQYYSIFLRNIQNRHDKSLIKQVQINLIYAYLQLLTNNNQSNSVNLHLSKGIEVIYYVRFGTIRNFSALFENYSALFGKTSSLFLKKSGSFIQLYRSFFALYCKKIPPIAWPLPEVQTEM